ncbi:chemotaxis protein [Photobacterium jeanii]|uniref:Chemotaxis protein n=1 Tax=Photobacterium jeanii TaxID=858640 RepID=A0A178KMJ8_9GAMM|nr:chemotaxis protein [Photobacterium jeanii]OAN17984.1 chemotaxis protein [Photobacterium jeanii]PST92346.1 chemotaxis protein [Photobacterium jeanii]
MPLPFILAGAAVAAASYGAKKGYDGYQDKTLANEILESAKKDYENEKEVFDVANDRTNRSLTKLGESQLKVGQDFKEFRTIAEKLLAQLELSGSHDLKIDIPQHKLDEIDGLALSATEYLSKVVAGGMGGAAAAYAVYGGVMALAAASTGTPIAALSGAAAYNAAMAAIGGGSLAAGGFGMAGGAMVLGGVVAAPIIAVAGWAFASHAEEALNDARETRIEVDDAVSKMVKGKKQLNKTRLYVDQIYTETNRVYQIFLTYFDSLKMMEQLINTGGDIKAVEDEVIRIIQNGYQVAAILTDIITTPLFKPKYDANGEVVINKDNVVEIETDKDGMQVINESAIKASMAKSQEDSRQFA